MFSVARTTGELLAETVRLARENAEAGQGPFGALVARDGEVVGIGVNTTIRDSDPTAHAEVEAIRSARGADLAGATLVSSCEPCRLGQAAATIPRHRARRRSACLQALLRIPLFNGT